MKRRPGKDEKDRREENGREEKEVAEKGKGTQEWIPPSVLRLEKGAVAVEPILALRV